MHNPMFKHFDIMVFDKEDLPVLVANVIRVHPFDKSRGLFYYQEVNKYAKRIGVEYVLIVAPSKMQLWSLSNDDILAEFDTATALAPYIGKEFTVEKVSKHYLKISVLIWLDNLVYPWKKSEVPCQEELEALGVLEQIEKGQVEFEVKE
ncbi:hypothetical protein H8E77_15230 [bacterium]|nr:hypothetical protein [bacterium]